MPVLSLDIRTLNPHFLRTQTLPAASVAQLERFLVALDRRHSYYSVTQFAGLILAEKIDIPCDLKLTLFAGGGDQDKQFAPHLTVYPIPLLAGVSSVPLPQPTAATSFTKMPGISSYAMQVKEALSVCHIGGPLLSAKVSLRGSLSRRQPNASPSPDTWCELMVLRIRVIPIRMPCCADSDTDGGSAAQERHLRRRLQCLAGLRQSQVASAHLSPLPVLRTAPGA